MASPSPLLSVSRVVAVFVGAAYGSVHKSSLQKQLKQEKKALGLPENGIVSFV